MHFRLLFFGVLFLHTGRVLRAVPSQDFGDAARAIEQIEEEKHLWSKPGVKDHPKGEFVARLRKEAVAGNVESQASLALCYHLGFGVAKDEAKAVEWYQKAAAAGHAGAQNNLAALYDLGLGVPVDHEKAQSLYLAAAQQGNADAQFNTAVNYADGIGTAQSWSEAKSWYEKAAAQGHFAAQTNLGIIYLLGRGVAVDNDRARELFKKPAEAGISVAQYGMAVVYTNEKKFPEMIPWLRRAAEAGHPGGELYWALALSEGRYVPKDEVAALTWARKASASRLKSFDPQELVKAHCLVVRLLPGDHPTVPSEQGAEAFHEASIAAESGFAEGQHLLGICYLRGAGVERSFANAVKWFRLAAKQKHIFAAESLAVILDVGKEGVPQDLVEAVKWHRMAAEGGISLSQYRLGICYRDGTGVETNPTEALKWLRLSQPAFPTDVQLQCAISKIERQLKQEAAALYKQGADLAHAADHGQSPSEEAIAIFKKAADLDEPHAIAILANLYHRGTGVPTDEAHAEALIAKVENTTDSAVLYFLAKIYLPVGTGPLGTNIERAIGYARRAAVQGYHPAENALGYYFMSGPVEHRDGAEAFKWLTLSANQGNVDARINMQRLLPTLTPAQIDEGTRRASEFLPTIEPSLTAANSPSPKADTAGIIPHLDAKADAIARILRQLIAEMSRFATDGDADMQAILHKHNLTGEIDWKKTMTADEKTAELTLQNVAVDLLQLQGRNKNAQALIEKFKIKQN